MGKQKPTLADLLRNHINDQLQKNFDYSLATNRKQDMLNFIELNKSKLEKNQTIDAIRPSHTRALDACLKNKGIDPQSLGRISKKPKFMGDMKPTITPEPQAGAVDQTVKQKPTGAQVGQVGVGEIQPAQPIIFDEKAVSATLNAFFLMFRLGYPDLELLTNDEKESLGKVWLPAFNKYMTENWAIIGIPLLATLGIFIPKIVEARKKKKIRDSKEEGLEKQKEIDSKNEQREKSIKTNIEPEKSATPEIGILQTKIQTEEKKSGTN